MPTQHKSALDAYIDESVAFGGCCDFGSGGTIFSTHGASFSLWHRNAPVGTSSPPSLLYGVRSGGLAESYELDISDHYYLYFDEEPQQLMGVTDDYSVGIHTYVRHPFAFIPSTGQFVENP